MNKTEQEQKEIESGKQFVDLCKKNGYKKETVEMLIALAGSVDDMVDAFNEFSSYVENKMTSSELVSAAIDYVTKKD